METIVGRNCYYRITYATGRGSIQCARVWNDQFLAKLSEEGANTKDEKDRFTVSAATEAEYRAEHWKKQA